ncbi:PHB depolymerase family esterase [Acidovorax sp. FG27]|uniref:extracellular catalytic domain type 1 short-chain-length polyhydroxyalkanoate depolymerase n=1 Tax=Acidovorax sp. FG27 TaxID=3133652 RepID=UPI0030E93FA9
MNHQFFSQWMDDAARSTRAGRLAEATEVIQRALRDAGLAPGAVQPPAAQPAAQGPASVAEQGSPWVLDGLTRVIDDDEPAAPARSPGVAPAGTARGATASSTPGGATGGVGGTGERWLRDSFTHRGRTLAYRLYLPPEPAATAGTAAASPRPLVVMLHGCTQNADDFAAGTQMNRLARDRGVAVLYPEQAQRDNAQQCWNWFKPQHQQRGRGEPAAIAALVQSVCAAHSIDPARIYVAGLSAGGAMADIMGQCYPDVFAAVGVHSGLPQGCAADVASALSVMRSGPSPVRGPGRAEGQRAPVPTIVFHGDADTTVHVSNGAAIAQAGSQAADAAQGRAGRRGASEATQGRSGRGDRHTRTLYTDAGGGTTVEYWKLHGTGHAWSGGSAAGSYTHPGGVDASAEMLRFFLEHPRAR